MLFLIFLKYLSPKVWREQCTKFLYTLDICSLRLPVLLSAWGNIYIHLCKCDGNDIILLTCNLHFKAPCSKTGSVSPSLSVTLTLTHIFTNTHKGHKLFLRSESPQFPQTALEMVQQERLPKLIIAGQLIRLLQPPSVPCTHGVDRGAESGLSL